MLTADWILRTYYFKHKPLKALNFAYVVRGHEITIMDWNSSIKEFNSFLKLERSLSDNSVEAYIHDIKKLTQFLAYKKYSLSPAEIELTQLQEFLKWANKLGMNARTQARVISGIKAFYKYLLLEDMISNDPTTLLETPKIGRLFKEIKIQLFRCWDGLFSEQCWGRYHW